MGPHKNNEVRCVVGWFLACLRVLLSVMWYPSKISIAKILLNLTLFSPQKWKI